MSRDRGDGAGRPAVKVVDRRRFRQDGEPAAGDARPEAGEPPAEDGAGQGRAEATAAPPEIEEKLRAQAARIDELSRAYAALLEDNKAFRTRMERERDRMVEAERARLAQALLDAADELELALAAVPADAGSLREGVKLVLAGLLRRIADMGATRIETARLPFDPAVAEAVDVVPVTEAAEDGLVVAEVRAGWLIGGRLLRPARVRVGRLARRENGAEAGPGRE